MTHPDTPTPDRPSSPTTGSKTTREERFPGLAQVLIGGYSAELDGTAEGITSWVASVGSTEPNGTAQLKFTPAMGYPVTSPSYLITHPTEPWVFAVSEATPATVMSLLLEPDGTVSLISAVETGDSWACHLGLSADLRFVMVANYAGGSISSHAIGPDGSLSVPVDRFELRGSGPEIDRQAGPHAHQVVVDGDEILVCDLGSDEVQRLRLSPEGAFAPAGEPVRLAAGSGPRHLVVIGDHLVVLCELNIEVWLGRRTADGWEEVMTIASSTAEAAERIYPSAIVADGRRIFVANRGAGTVAVFDLVDDRLEPRCEFPCGGAWPRDIKLGPGQLWVANQTNDVVSVFSTDVLPPSTVDFEIATPSPACIVLIAEPRSR